MRSQLLTVNLSKPQKSKLAKRLTYLYNTFSIKSSFGMVVTLMGVFSADLDESSDSLFLYSYFTIIII